MTKDSAAWLIIRTIGLIFLLWTVGEWAIALLRAAALLQLATAFSGIGTMTSPTPAELGLMALGKLFKAIGLSLASWYFLAGGRFVHRRLMRE
jgi:hypothetical protein